MLRSTNFLFFGICPNILIWSEQYVCLRFGICAPFFFCVGQPAVGLPRLQALRSAAEERKGYFEEVP